MRRRSRLWLSACLVIRLAAAEPVWPPPLPPGGTICFVATSLPAERAALDRGAARLRQRGFTVRIAPGCTDARVARRVADLQAAWHNPRIDALWVVRGGHGAGELLDRLDWRLARARPVRLIGYSDITLVQLALAAHTDQVSFSGPMVAEQFGLGNRTSPDADTFADSLRWLGAGPDAGSIWIPADRPPLVWRDGEATGRLLGTNLSRVAELCAPARRRHLPEMTGAILVLEDIRETPTTIAGFLDDLAAAGVLERIGGLVLGDFSRCASLETLRRLVFDRLGGRDIPVLARYPHGHLGRKSVLPIGATVHLTTSPPAILVVPPRPM